MKHYTKLKHITQHVTLAFVLLLFTGCSTMHIMKECAGTEIENIYICKNLKPWE